MIVGAGTVNVLRGKGGKQRTVGLDATAFALAKCWLDQRRELGLSSSVFRSFRPGAQRALDRRPSLAQPASTRGTTAQDVLTHSKREVSQSRWPVP